MKISVITVCYNAASTIQDTIDSVASQDYPDIEYIIYDGASTDGTVEVIRKNEHHISKWFSEPDKGIYDAMNKAIKHATGEVVGIINADDFYASPHSLSRIMEIFQREQVDSVFGDLFIVDPSDTGRIVRRYSSANFYRKRFAWGFMPAHPSFFVRREAYDRYGVFKTDYEIAADYELLIRFLYVNKLSYYYYGEPVVKMRRGGVSSASWKSNIILNQEIKRGCDENGLPTNYFMIYSKYFKKVWELIKK